MRCLRPDERRPGDILEMSLSLVYDTPTDDRVQWFSQVVALCKARAAARTMLDKDSAYMKDYWAGEWSEEKAERIRSALF